MYHSIFFDSWNTFDDWHLVPLSRPLFAPPSVKTTTISVPGANGTIDVSEILTGYPVYDNRKGSIDFTVLNGYGEWYERYSTISNILHGQKMRAVLEDELDYYYEGRFTINSWKSDKDRSKITIDYDVNPYKYLVRSSLDFPIYDHIPLLRTEELALTYSRETYGYAPICPKIILDINSQYIVEAEIKMSFSNPTLNINLEDVLLLPGENIFPELIIYGPEVTFQFRSNRNANVSIEFHKGSL